MPDARFWKDNQPVVTVIAVSRNKKNPGSGTQGPPWRAEGHPRTPTAVRKVAESEAIFLDVIKSGVPASSHVASFSAKPYPACIGSDATQHPVAPRKHFPCRILAPRLK
jgi:hypothetical protein